MTLYVNGRSQPDVSGGLPGEANTGANVGAGAGLFFRNKLGVVLNFRTLLAGLGISVATVGDEVTISSDVATMLAWGNSGISATTTTRFLAPFYDDSLAKTSVVQFRVTRDGTLRKLRVRQNSPAGNGNDIVYTVRVEGVATALSVTMASTATDGADLVNEIAVVDGDRIDIEVTKAAGVGASPSDIMAVLEFA